MDIIITMMDGTSHTLNVDPQDTVGRLKQVVQERLGVTPQRQRLVLVDGQRNDLSDESRTLGSYGLRSGSRVSLLIIEPAPAPVPAPAPAPVPAPAPAPATIQVFLRNDNGKLRTYDIKPDETVSVFKSKVECVEGVPVSQQRLVFQGREMSSGKLSDYRVQAQSTIDLLLRLRGGW